MLEGFAEYYSAELAEKVTRGLRLNAEKAKYNGSPLPIGYYIDDERHYRIDETTAPFVIEMFERYAAGDSFLSILNDMNNYGVRIHIKHNKTPSRKPFELKLKYGTLRHLLTNRIYIGEYKYGDIIIKDGVPPPYY